MFVGLVGGGLANAQRTRHRERLSSSSRTFNVCFGSSEGPLCVEVGLLYSSGEADNDRLDEDKAACGSDCQRAFCGMSLDGDVLRRSQ